MKTPTVDQIILLDLPLTKTISKLIITQMYEINFKYGDFPNMAGYSFSIFGKCVWMFYSSMDGQNQSWSPDF